MLIQTEHDIVKNPNWLEPNQSATSVCEDLNLRLPRKPGSGYIKTRQKQKSYRKFFNRYVSTDSRQFDDVSVTSTEQFPSKLKVTAAVEILKALPPQ